MYITYKRLCNVISESVAVEFFGKQFVEFKQRTDNDESAKDVADEILTKIGKGSTREVYKFKDNPNIVLKIINWNDNIGVDSKTGFAKKQMIDSNKWESDLNRTIVCLEFFQGHSSMQMTSHGLYLKR